MYIEPCCCDRQLPALLRSGVPFFQTNGDVTVQKMLQAVSHFAGKSHVLLLQMPEADVSLLRTIRHYMEKGWTSSLLLLTQKPQDELIRGELEGHISKVQYACDPLVLDGLCAISGDTGTVIIQGAVITDTDFSLCNYACYYGSDRNVISAAVSPTLSKLRIKPLIETTTAAAAAMLSY